MAYTSKYTGGQIEEKLDEIFASKLQEKAVEIVDNGATEVSADEGFLGLGKVSINVNVSTSGGGGTELEGEYYLAKPNGRYWKLILNWNSMNEEQQLCVRDIYITLASFGSVYTCVGEKVHKGGIVPQNGIYYTTYGKIQSNLGYSEARMEFDSEGGDLLSCFAWQEAYPHLPSFVSDYLPDVTTTSLFDFVKLMFELDSGYTPSDEEVYAIMAQIYVMEPITKEEYEDMVSRAEGEDY